MKTLFLILFTMAAFSAGYVTAGRWTGRGSTGPRVLGTFAYVLVLVSTAFWARHQRGWSLACYLLCTFLVAAFVHWVEARSAVVPLAGSGEFAVYQTKPRSPGAWGAVQRFTRDVSDCDSRLLLVVLYFLLGLLIFPFLARRRQVVTEKNGQTASSWAGRKAVPGSLRDLQRPF